MKMLYYSYPPNGMGFMPVQPLNPYNYTWENLRQEKMPPKNAIFQQQNISPDIFKISYPVIVGGTTDKAKKKINDEIVDTVSDLFEKNIILSKKTNFKEINMFYKITLNRKDIVSILFGCYTYVDKAAHGYTAYASLTVNLKTGESYDLEDLFNSKSSYIQELNNIIERYIKINNIPANDTIQSITNDQEFYLKPKSLVMYFPVGKYTPYSYGLFKIVIPYSSIKNLLGPKSPIQNLLI